jgi:hypothetical protein
MLIEQFEYFGDTTCPTVRRLIQVYTINLLWIKSIFISTERRLNASASTTSTPAKISGRVMTRPLVKPKTAFFPENSDNDKMKR